MQLSVQTESVILEKEEELRDEQREREVKVRWKELESEDVRLWSLRAGLCHVACEHAHGCSREGGIGKHCKEPEGLIGQ